MFPRTTKLETKVILLKEKNQKQLSLDWNESVSKTKLFGANLMQIWL